jgi:hypothetical protein
MSLRKKPTTTAKRVAASRANGRRSRGPVTRAGRERIRDANTRHGFYSKSEGTALRALGEDPAKFDAVVKALMEKWRPANGFEELLVMRLARALWLMDRADRMQEGYALRQAKDVNRGREDRVHAQMMRQKMTSASLQTLAQSVARERYVTTSDDLELMKGLHREGAMREMGEMALALFYQLQAPGEQEEGEEDDGEDGPDHDANVRKVVARVREIFGLSPEPEPEADAAPSSDTQGSESDAGATEQEEEEPNSGVSSAEWEGREPVRRLLEHILARQVEICEAERKATLRESLLGPSPYERAAEIAPTEPNTSLMRRMQDSNFRQMWRVTNLLLKVKRQAQEEEAWESASGTLNVHENAGG